jgi:undecaprenyl-diphosphatase
MPELITQLDTALFFFLNRGCQNRVFDLIMPVITNRANLIILPFLAVFFFRERKKALIIFAAAFFSIMLADGLGNVLKHAIGRERPCNVLEGIHLLVGCTRSFSMPSNHATNSFAFAVPFLVMTKNRLRYLFLFIAVLVSLSRVSVGVHYPGDVIAGALEGALSAGAVIALYRWAEKRFRERPYTTVMYVFLAALTLFRMYYLSFGPLDLSGDEAHYWEWSRRLDLSYYSKGPMIAYLIAFSTSVFGDTVFGVRFFAVVLSLLGSIILYRLGKEMFGERIGAASALLFQIIPLFSTFGVIFTIDSPFTFFWILSLYLFWKAVTNNKLQVTSEEQAENYPPLSPLGKGGSKEGWVYWILLGISVGTGLLTKYTMAFFHVSALFFLLSSAPHRRLLKTAAPYLSLVISIVLFLPVIVWNAQHDWVTVRHTAGQAHVADGLQLSIKSFLEFAGSQFGVITPVIFVLMLIALWKIKGEDPEPRRRCGQFLFWFSAPIIFFFFLKSVQGKVQPNWAMTGYVTGIIAFSEVFLNGWERYRPSLKTLIISGIALSLTLTVVAHYPSKFHLPQRLDPSSRLRGWSDLGKQVHELYDETKEKGSVFISSDSYQIASELAFYVERHPVTYCMNIGRRMNQYDLWTGFQNLVHYNGIFVTIGDAEIPPGIGAAFQSCEKRALKVSDRGRVLRKHTAFLCYNFRGIKEEQIRRY